MELKDPLTLRQLFDRFSSIHDADFELCHGWGRAAFWVEVITLLQQIAPCPGLEEVGGRRQYPIRAGRTWAVGGSERDGGEVLKCGPGILPLFTMAEHIA